MAYHACKGNCERDIEYVGISPHNWCLKGYKQCNQCKATFNTKRLSCKCCHYRLRVFPRKTKNREQTRVKLKQLEITVGINGLYTRN